MVTRAEKKPHVYRGILVFAISLFTLLALLTFNSFDPPAGNYPHNKPAANGCGVVGAYISYALLFYVGPLAAYSLVVLSGLWGVFFLLGREVRAGWGRFLGVAFFVLAVSALSSRALLAGWGSRMTWDLPSLGGIVGEALARLSVSIFARPGTFTILLTGMVLSLLFATDMVVLSLSAACLHKAASALRTMKAGETFRRAKRAAACGPAKSVLSIVEGKESAREALMDDSTRRDAESPKVRFRESARPLVGLKSEPASPKVKQEERSAEPPRVEASVIELTKEEPKAEARSVSRHVASTRREEPTSYPLPPADLLEDPTPSSIREHERLIQEQAQILERTLEDFDIAARVVEIDTGPVITQYELELAPGIKVGKIIGLSDDIAMALKAPSVRIVAPIPGKSTVGVEVPNLEKDIVRMKELLLGAEAEIHKKHIPVFLGKDASGSPMIADLVDMPHVLIAGCTGSGKSVCLNSIILSILFTRTPDEVRLMLLDPKMVELSAFKDIPHLVCPVVTDMRKAASVLEWAMGKMDERYNLLARAGVRNIRTYNQLGKDEITRRFDLAEADEDERAMIPFHMPYLVIVVDELADLMMVAAKEVEGYVTRLAQKSRAVGIHIVMATQRPSVDVITGLIKSNLPCRVSFQVSSKVDSRTILDQNGAEKLLGRGDMLYIPPGTAKLVRAQGTYVSDAEIKNVIKYLIEHSNQSFSKELLHLRASSASDESERDELFDEGVRIILESQRGSVSLLQRRLEIGYSRAARLVDMMFEAGIVGEYKGSQAREVLMTLEEWESLAASRKNEEEEAHA